MTSPIDAGALTRVYRTHQLGTVAELVVTNSGDLFDASELLNRELERIDRVASRFRADSELTALNAAAGTDVPVSEDLYEAVDTAIRMAEATEGLVDPTIGHALESLGYDRDFQDVAPGVAGTMPAPCPVPGWRAVGMDPQHRIVTVAPGCTLDLGATAKALAADKAAATIHEHLGCGVLVSLGGDASVAGPPPTGGFAIGVADSCRSLTPAQTVAVFSGGLASSGIDTRRWRLDKTMVHHIVDPTTGLPATPCWRTVSVAAANCVQANAASTAACIMGTSAVEWLEARRLPARLVGRDGTVHCTSAWPCSDEAAAS